jgi:hypothetical protein
VAASQRAYDAISAAGAAGSLADLFSINNCPATSITAANAGIAEPVHPDGLVKVGNESAQVSILRLHLVYCRELCRI